MDISSVSDGTYVGRADNGFVKAAVSVEVSDGKLKSITILEHDTLLGRPGEKNHRRHCRTAVTGGRCGQFCHIQQ